MNRPPLPHRRHVLRGLGATGLLVHSGALSLLAACREGDDTSSHDTGDTSGHDLLRFAVITDTHVKADPASINNQTLLETIAILNARRPPLDLVLMTGDLVDELPSDEPAYYDEHDDTALHRFEEALAACTVATLPALGNHDYFMAGGGLINDLTDDFAAREALFQARLGMPGPWYRTDISGIAFYALNTMQPHPDAAWQPNSCGSFGPEQVAWLEEQLSDGVPAVLFFHHPLALDNAVSHAVSQVVPFEVPRAEGGYEKYEDTEYEGWTDPIYAVLERFAGQILAAFVGHGHWFIQDTFGGFPVMETDSVGNSYQRTETGEGDDAQPMRYHLVTIDLTAGTLAVTNDDLFSYNADSV
ncbi:MAG: metallophosphoesterase [Pseudomonadota bacterium]